ncbi:uncharacterized protein LOC122508695 [Leptopilina heterotoma]|uniref:uncharacterized protein LOC122508695 n=1 Tax=Leptopilina heterotoma TaxID=63436 RepID=UPI001CA97BD7|nr:uncharacterized protein LOC122508695 [Leptopilina heterotoma]
MDALHLSNSLSTVQVIPIFQYLSIISDFLFLENYLPEVDQYKPIPVVNELYRYFVENRAYQNKTLLLIRNLLKGSDLYGEQENETPDEIFITTLFDYIISSLVFAKYGNIYGFLAESISRVDDLKFDSVIKKLDDSLEKAKFQNECGDSSTLTPLSVFRIFKDIILPLFPQPLFNINLLSLDYIYAMAASAYLRFGRLNETYYSNYKQLNSRKRTHRIMFDEYVSIGYIIEELYYQNIDPVALKTFAFPALLHYITTKEKINAKNITTVIFNPKHLKKVYSVFFEHLKSVSKEIESQLENDYTYKIHRAFSNFVSRAKYAKLVLDYQCRHLNDYQRKAKIDIYIDNAERYKCRAGDYLPNINDWFMDQIDAFGELYEKYDYGIMQKIFNESSIDLDNIAIKLIVTNDEVENKNFNTSQHLSYDLLEFHNTIASTVEYYALVRQNYTVTLVKESKDPEYFKKLIGPSKYTNERIVLKNTKDSAEQFCQKITKYKKERFVSYLTYSDNSPEKSKWWREFGFSFVPLYPCVSDINHYGELSIKLCEQENIKFLTKYPEVMSTNLVNQNTKDILFTLGTNIEYVFLKESLRSTVISLKASRSKSTSEFQKLANEFYEKLSLHLEEPKYEIMWFSEDGVRFMIEIINYSDVNVKKMFKHSKNVLYKLLLLKGSFIIDITDHEVDKLSESIFIKSWNGVTGYGYKFSYAGEDAPSASLLIGYEFKDVGNSILLLPNSLSNKIHIEFKSKIKCNADELICKNNATPTIDTSFIGIWTHENNEDKCSYIKGKRESDFCLRHKSYIQKFNDDAAILSDISKNAALDPLVKNEIREILKWFTFPSKKIAIEFLTNWMKDILFVNSVWSRDNILDTTGVLNVLFYNTSLDNIFMSKSEAESKINSSYTYRERSKIEKKMSVEHLLKEYEVRRGDYSATFEDYYALRNFITTGYQRIMSDTHEANLMKLALYRLALRQSVDFDEENEMKLYIFESVSEDIFRKKFMKGNSEIANLGKNITLQKFLPTILSEEAALKFAESPASGFRNVLYEIKFFSSYLRVIVDVEVKMNLREKRIIILPGNKFYLEKILPVPTVKIGTYFKVHLTSASQNDNKFELCKNVLRQMAKLDQA